MKKALLLSGLLVAGSFSAKAFEEPKTYESASFQAISPNGQYLASSMLGTVIIYDLVNGIEYTYEGSEYGEPYYSGGLGNFISDNGIVLGSTSGNCNACYWQAGEWHDLEVAGSTGLSDLANGITPDGARICGSLGVAPVSYEEDNIMLAPVYWDRNADGSYGTYHTLPYPEKDFTGRPPQYITANCISDDGKTIAGQIVDCRGFFYTPIVYHQNENGEWSYKIILEDLFNPADANMPPYPGESPAYPDAKSFMDEDEKAAYDKAYQDFVDSGYDYSIYPNEADFLTGDHKTAYEEAMAKYNEEFAAWQEAYNKFDEAYFKVVDNAPQFTFNDVKLSADGTTYYTDCSVVDDSDPYAYPPATIDTPWAIRIDDNEVTKYDFGKSMVFASIPNDEVIFTFNGVGSLPMEGYIIKDGECTPIQDWLASFSTDLKEWIDKNLVQEIENYDWELDEVVIEKMLVTGMPFASADLKTVALWNDAPASYTDYAVGYVFNLGQYLGVKDSVIAGKNAVAFDAAGNLRVDGELTALYLYDLSGRCVLSASAPAGTVSCNLPSGVYIVKGCTTDGSFSAKIAK